MSRVAPGARRSPSRRPRADGVAPFADREDCLRTLASAVRRCVASAESDDDWETDPADFIPPHLRARGRILLRCGPPHPGRRGEASAREARRTVA